MIKLYDNGIYLVHGSEIVPAPGEGGTSFTADQLSVSQSVVGTAEPQ